jgi:hypothetical protein
MKSLGVDISTSNIGYCEMTYDSIKYFSVRLDKFASHKYRRKLVRDTLKIFNPDIVVLESIRLFHKSFINIDVIKRLGGTTYLIVDFFDCNTFSIDVRSWKSIILGPCKKGEKRKKEESIFYVEDKYGIMVNDDVADAICLAEVGMFYKNKIKRVE